MQLHGLVPNSYIHVSVSDLCISRISMPIWLQQNRQTDPGNIKIAHRYMNVEIGRQNIINLFLNNEAAQFHFRAYINRNQTFILNSHRPFICSVYSWVLMKTVFLGQFWLRKDRSKLHANARPSFSFCYPNLQKRSRRFRKNFLNYFKFQKVKINFSWQNLHMVAWLVRKQSCNNTYELYCTVDV